MKIQTFIEYVPDKVKKLGPREFSKVYYLLGARIRLAQKAKYVLYLKFVPLDNVQNFCFLWLPIVNVMASTSMSDAILQMLLTIAIIDKVLMAAIAITAEMANLAQWFVCL